MRDELIDCARELLETVPLVMQTIRMEMRSQRTPDLSVPQFRALAFIDGNPGASLSEMAEHLGMNLPSTSKMVDGLVRRDLASRRDDPDDRRRMALSLTVQGEAILRSARQATLRYMTLKLGQLDPSDLELIRQAMLVLRPVFMPELVIESNR